MPLNQHIQRQLMESPKYVEATKILDDLLQQVGSDKDVRFFKTGLGLRKKKKGPKVKKQRVRKGHCFSDSHVRMLVEKISQFPKTDLQVRPSLMSALVGHMGSKSFFANGTQVFTFRLYATPAQVTSGVGGFIQTTFEIRLNQLIDSASLANIFDEFRIMKGKVTHVPYSHHAYDSSLTGAVPAAMNLSMDYDSSALVSSYTANERDNTVHCCTNDIASVDFLPMGQPDLVWETTATTTTIKGTAKWYADRASISSTYARIFAWFDVEFRCVQ